MVRLKTSTVKMEIPCQLEVVLVVVLLLLLPGNVMRKLRTWTIVDFKLTGTVHWALTLEGLSDFQLHIPALQASSLHMAWCRGGASWHMQILLTLLEY